jgi:hypothetical protein
MCITNLDQQKLLATCFHENCMLADQERQGREGEEYYVCGRGGMWGEKGQFAPANV